MAYRSTMLSILLQPLVAISIAGAEGTPAPATQAPGMPPAAHTMLRPEEMKWGPGPDALPPGGKMVVLSGDPAKAGLFIALSRMPAGYRVPAHWHPTDEKLTVLSGELGMGTGDKLDPAKVKAYPAGSFLNMPARTRHFVVTKQETVIQVTAMGPFAINYINPADDPRHEAMEPKAGRTK